MASKHDGTRARATACLVASALLALLSACLEIDQVQQPSIVAPGDTLTVTLQIHSQDTDPNPHAVFVTALVPNDWDAIGATYHSQKYGSGEFVLSQYWADSCEVVHPSGPEYKWVGFLTPRAFLANENRIDATIVLRLKVGQQTGEYKLAYTLGEDALGYDTSWGDVYDAVFDLPISVVAHLAVPRDYRTIQAALDAAQPGMVVAVDAGVYVEHLRLKRGVTLLGAGAEKTVVLATDPWPTIVGAEAAVISALRMVNTAPQGVVVDCWGAHGISLHDCEIVVPPQGKGVACDSSTAVSVERNTLRSTGPGARAAVLAHSQVEVLSNRVEGFLLGVELRHCTGRVAYNLIVGCDSAGIRLDTSRSVTVVNNTVDGCGHGAIAQASTAEFFNNIVAHSRGFGICADGGVSCRYNNLWQNASGSCQGCVPGPGSISVDPAFVGGVPFDYHLRPGSPCIDAGDPAGPRDPDGTIADLGAFPFQQPGIPSSINYVYLIHFTHLDIGFTDPQDVVAEKYKGIIDKAIEFAEMIPGYEWTIESVWQLEQWLARSTPSDIARLQRLVDSGRIHLCAGYANMHTAVLGSEEINRFLYPAEQYRRRFGFAATTVLQNDVPGFSWWMPTVLANAGVRYFAAGVNQSFGGSAQIPRQHNPFYWQGPDGQKVLTWISRGSYMEWLNTYQMGNVSTFYSALEKELQAYQAAGYPYDAILIMVGSLENTYPTTLITSMAAAWNQRYANPKLVVAGPDEFFAYLQQKYGEQFATYRGDWAGGWDLVSLNVPQSMGMNRQAHDLAAAAEKIATVNDLLGLDSYSRSVFDSVYANMLQFDEHSGGGAPWPGLMTPEETQRQSEIAVGYARNAFAGSLSELTQGLRLMAQQVAAPAPAIVVFNPLSWPRSDVIRVRVDSRWSGQAVRLEDAETGKVVPHQWLSDSLLFLAEDVPPLGYRLFVFRDSGGEMVTGHALRTPSNVELENEFFRIRVDASDGRVVSIFDKTYQRELVNRASPFPFNGWLKAEGGGEIVMPMGSARIDTSVRGPVARALVIERSGTPFVRSEIWLYHNLRRVEVVNTMDRRLMDWVPNSIGSEYYAYVFPFALWGFQTYLEGPHGAWNPETDHLPGAPRGTFAVQHGGGITDGQYRILWAMREPFAVEFERFHGVENTFAPREATLLCRFIKKEDEGRFEGGTVGPIEAEPGTSSLIISTFAFCGDSGGFDPVIASQFWWGHGSALQGCEVVRNEAGALSAPAASFLWCDQPQVMVVAFKRAHWGGGAIVRLMELNGKPAEVTLRSDVFRMGAATITDGLEHDLGGATVASGGVRLQVGPREIKTVRLSELTTGALQYPPESSPWDYQLEQNYPNPFNPETNICYFLPRPAKVHIAVFNTKGQLVRTLVDATVPEGRHVVRWRGDDASGQLLASGLYFCRMTVAGQVRQRKVILLK